MTKLQKSLFRQNSSYNTNAVIRLIHALVDLYITSLHNVHRSTGTEQITPGTYKFKMLVSNHIGCGMRPLRTLSS